MLLLAEPVYSALLPAKLLCSKSKQPATEVAGFILHLQAAVLLEFDSGASFFQLLFNVFSFVLGGAFLDS